MAERVIDVNIAEQSRQDLQDYAIYVARNRAIPEMVDGLNQLSEESYGVQQMTLEVKDLSKHRISWAKLFVNITHMAMHQYKWPLEI